MALHRPGGAQDEYQHSTNDNNLEAPLLEEDEPKHAIRSRVRLASRQAAYYVLAIYYAVCFLVYSVRLLRSRGEQRARLYRAGADLLRAVAWIVAAKADAQECRSSPARPSLAAAAFRKLARRSRRCADARLRGEISPVGAEPVGALCARGLARGYLNRRQGDAARAAAVAGRKCH